MPDAGFRTMGLTVVPSEANFVMLVLPDEQAAAGLVEEFLKQGVVDTAAEGVRSAAAACVSPPGPKRTTGVVWKRRRDTGTDEHR